MDKKLIASLYGKYGAKAATTKLICADRSTFDKLRVLGKKHGRTAAQQAWCIVHKINKPPVCKECGGSVQQKHGYKDFATYCSNKCANQSVQERSKLTLQKRYGVTNISQVDEIKDKKVVTCLANHGVDFPQQSKQVRKKTMCSVVDKFGVDNVSKSTSVQEKRVATFVKRYGVTNPMFDKGLREYAASRLAQVRGRWKIGKVAGKSFEYRGYELRAVRFIHRKLDVPIEDIHMSNRVIPYIIRNKQHNYLPDIEFYKNGKLHIWEVKSWYTVGYDNREVWRTVKAKAKATVLAGFNFSIVVFRSQRGKVCRLDSVPTLNWRDLRTKLETYGSYR